MTFFATLIATPHSVAARHHAFVIWIRIRLSPDRVELGRVIVPDPLSHCLCAVCKLREADGDIIVLPEISVY
ncbi:hypothetical protein PQQ53_15050 [Paraburkholderia strydomiana]|jgi:hypothetical protein|uniref:Secreted protein n=1 Tax=Paraburkholderia strydomiana TaxID=1245417 RepID=A0ABW9EEZ7_9BURK